MAGFDRQTGKPISGWAETQQSLQVLLTTEVGERVMRRRLGNPGSGLLDRPGNLETVLDHFAAIADAIEPRIVNGFQYGEPRFDLARIVPHGDESGRYEFELFGLHYPRGHLGDFSVWEAVSGVVALADAATVAG